MSKVQRGRAQSPYVLKKSSHKGYTMLEHLFDRCPVLPVDTAVSLAKYANVVRSHVNDAKTYEKAGDGERAALLYMRCMVLICKTIPAHPEYRMPENKAIRRDLAALAGSCLERLESYAMTIHGVDISERGGTELTNPMSAEKLLQVPELDTKSSSRLETTPETSAGPSDSHVVNKRPRMRPVVVPQRLIGLFERIATRNKTVRAQTIGILAGQVSEAEDGVSAKFAVVHSGTGTCDPTEAKTCASRGDIGSMPLEITALIIPSQVPAEGAGEVDMLHEGDVASLLAAKGLVQLGWILALPDSSMTPNLDSLAAHRQYRVQMHQPSAATLVVSQHHVTALALSESEGMDCIRRCNIRGSHSHNGRDVAEPDDNDTEPVSSISESPEASDAATRASLVVRAKHVTVCLDPEALQFKLYDVRPMALYHVGEREKSVRETDE